MHLVSGSAPGLPARRDAGILWGSAAMTLLTPPAPTVKSPVLPPPHRVTLEEYMRMAEAGVFGEGTNVELVEGEILEMSPQGDRHTWTISLWTRVLVGAVGEANSVFVQSTLPLGPRFAPQPDLAIIEGREDENFRTGKPLNVLLVVEVAETSVVYDTGVKAALYARHGVPQLVVVDLPHRRLLHYTEPAETGYLRSEPLTPGDELRILALDLALPVADLFL